MAQARTNDEWGDIARAVAHLWWDCDDEAEHDRWAAIAERCYDGTATEEDRREIAEQHEEWAEHYGCDDWYED